MILTQLPGQELHLEVFDYDMDMKDDFMGRYNYKALTGIIQFNKVSKMKSILTCPKIQAEDRSERHHRLSVHWSGGAFVHKNTQRHVME